MSTSGDPWSGFVHDPRNPAAAGLRAGDADREIIHRILADAFAEGRLDREEYDERSTSVLSARTLGELPPLVADLVPERPLAVPVRSSLVSATPADLQRRAEERWLEHRRHALLGFIGPSLICWTIWLAVNWGDMSPFPFPWPAIVMAVTLVNLVRTIVSKDEIVAEEVRALERRQAKKLKAQQEHPDRDERSK